MDRAVFFVAPRILGEGRGLIEGFGFGSMQRALRFLPERSEVLDGDLWLEGRLEVS